MLTYNVQAKSWHNYNDLPPDVHVVVNLRVMHDEDGPSARMAAMNGVDEHLRKVSKDYRTAVNRVQEVALV